MKKRAKKSAAKTAAPKKKAGAKAKKPTTTKAAAPVTRSVSTYTPAPLTSDGWPPFRYPLT